MSPLETIFRKLALKSGLVEANSFWTCLFGEIEKQTNKQRGMLRDNERPIPVMVQPTRFHANGTTNAFILEYPKINQNYMVLQTMTQIDATIHWQMIYEQKTPTIIMLNGQQEPFGFPEIDKPLKFGSYEITCDSEDVQPSYFCRHMTLKNRDSKVEEEPHCFVYYQFRSWKLYGIPPEPLFGDFHQFLIDNNDLKTDAEPCENPLLSFTPTTSCPLIISPPGTGRAGALILADVIYRMAIENVKDDFCIEQMAIKLMKKRPEMFQSFTEIKLIYTHSMCLMEKKEEKFRQLRMDLLEYGKSVMILPTTRSIKQFMTPNAWAPWQWRVNWFVGNLEKERKRKAMVEKRIMAAVVEGEAKEETKEETKDEPKNEPMEKPQGIKMTQF